LGQRPDSKIDFHDGLSSDVNHGLNFLPGPT
jgi:hypothetical protein